ncbi:MAG TPA: EscU/YscU/HrcU family type III secretion system export apparatus switch protein, partial [Rhizomicrobium sp.]
MDEAEKHGDIVKSTEVTTFVVLLGATLTIGIFGQSTATKFASTFRIFLEQPDQFALDSTSIMALFRQLLLALAALLGPIFAVLAVTGASGHILQHRPSLSFERIAPSFSKLSPMSGLKKIFGFDGVINLGKSLLKIAVVGGVLWTVLWPERGTFGALLGVEPQQIAGAIVHLLMKLLTATLAVLAVLAVLDYVLQRYRFLQRNRMSKQEIKE